MINLTAFHNTKIRLFVFFMYPQIAKHFIAGAVEWHTIFPCFCYVTVVRENYFPECQQATLYRLLLCQEKVIGWFQHLHPSLKTTIAFEDYGSLCFRHFIF